MITYCTQCRQPFDTDPEWEERYCNSCRVLIAQQEHAERLEVTSLIDPSRSKVSDVSQTIQQHIQFFRDELALLQQAECNSKPFVRSCKEHVQSTLVVHSEESRLALDFVNAHIENRGKR